MPERSSHLTADAYFTVIPEWVLWHRDLSDRAVRLYGTLRRRADQQGEGAFPARSTLAELLRCSLDSVDRALRELRDAGAVTWERRLDPAGDPTSSLYTVHAAPLRQGSRTSAATCSRTDAATGSRTRAAQVESPFEREPSDPHLAAAAPQRPQGGSGEAEAAPRSLPTSARSHVSDVDPDYPTAAEALGPGCREPGCDRHQGHRGPHRNPWWDAIAEAVYPGEGIPEHQEKLAGRLAARARKAGHPPERILEAADWIHTTWGPDRLTLGCLNQHYERATGELARNADQVRRRLTARLPRRGPAGPSHVHQWAPHHKRPDLQVCTVPGCPEGQRTASA